MIQAMSDEWLQARTVTNTSAPPDPPTIELPTVESVLDFGCGLGRNSSYLKTIAREVHGFDVPEALADCDGHPTYGTDRLSRDWSITRQRRFDLIFASLVLEHLPTERAASFLDDFAAMAPHLYLLTRARSDFGAALLDLIVETRAYDPGPCRILDNDPGTHRFRVVAEASFDAARRSPDDVHYELLLRSRNF